MTQRQIETGSVSRAVCSSDMYMQPDNMLGSLIPTCSSPPPFHSEKEEEEERLEGELRELEGRLEAAKEDLSVATMNLRAMIRAFKESRLLPQPGQFAGELSLLLVILSFLSLSRH